MADPRLLICATSYLPDLPSIELAKLSHRVIKHLNPGEDIKIIDCGSPFDPALTFAGADIFKFDENVGAISRGGGDGAGRSCCKAIELAIEGGYDYLVVHETDFIFAKSCREIVNRMHKAGVKVACPGWATPYLFPEYGVLFMSVQYAKDTDYIGRYDWQTSKPLPIVEKRLQAMFGDDLWFFPALGMRNEHNQLNVANIANMYPYGNPVWLTHCADPMLYYRLLDLNSVHLT